MSSRSRDLSCHQLGKLGGSSADNYPEEQSGKEDASEGSERANSKEGLQGSRKSDSDAAEVEDDMDDATNSAAQNSAAKQKEVPELSGKHAGDDTRPDPLATAEASPRHGKHKQKQNTSKAAQGAHQHQHQHHHHRLTDEVFLRAESITEREMKAITLAQYFAQFVATALLVVEVVLKFAQSGRQYITSKHTEYWNVSIAAVLLVALTACLSIFAARLIRLRHRHWSRRRRYITYLILIEACLQMLNLICWLAGNAYVLAHRCGWFDNTVQVLAFVKWTSWNCLFMIYLVESRNLTFWKHKGKVVKKHGKDRLVMDAPVWNHAWILINWVVFEGITIGLLVTAMTEYDDRFTSNPNRCTSFTYNCKQKPATLALLCVLFVAWFLWIFLWMYYIYRALTDLRKRPWQKYKMANTTIRVQLRMRLYSEIVFGLCVALLALTKPNSCASYVQTWLGFSPMMVMETTMTAGLLFYFMPKTPEITRPMLQLWRQEFSWTESGKQEKLEIRNERLSVLHNEAILEEPMFCFETAVKAFYWTALVYEYNEEEAASAADRKPDHPTVGGYTLEKAMDLYNLERFELLVEPAEDTKVLLGWNSDTIVISFRGTASLTNALADIRIWRTPHPPKRGAWLLGQQPEVHSGFLVSWTANGLNLRVLDRVRDILGTPGADVENMRVLLTGHSLGGAQATLAAIDIAREFRNQLSKQQILVYPFGAPRTGNHAFARDYNRTCPDTWHIINDRDLITRSGKLFHLYKRPGQRVLINNRGDMLVRPAFVEMTAQTMPFRGSIQHHLLASYQASFLAICSAQFGEKAFEDGVEGMGQLISSGEVRDVLSKGYLDNAKAERIANIGGRALWQLGAIGDQVTRAVGIPSAESKAQAKAPPKGHLRCHDGVCWREPEDGLTQEEGSIGWLRDKSKGSINNSAAPRASDDSARGLFESRSQKPLPGAKVSVSKLPPGSKMRSSSRALSARSSSSNIGDEERAKEVTSGPRENPSLEPGDLLQHSHSATAGQGSAKNLQVSMLAAGVADANESAKMDEFWRSDVEDLERGEGGAWEEGCPEVFREAYIQRFSEPAAVSDVHRGVGEPAERGPAANGSQKQQEEADGSRGGKAKVANSGADGLSDRPGDGSGNASASATAAASKAQDSHALKGREANGVQQIASGDIKEQGSHRHHGLHLPHLRLPHFHHNASLKEKDSGASLGDPTSSWDISSKAASTPSLPSHRNSGPQSMHSQSQEEEGLRHNGSPGLGKDHEELKMSHKGNNYVPEAQAADLRAADPNASVSQGSQFYRPSKEEALTASRWDNGHGAGRKEGVQSAEAPVATEAAGASRRHADAGPASSFRSGSGESTASQDSWHSASLEEKIQHMASEGLLSEALQESQERHLDEQQSWARRHLLSLPRRTHERPPSEPEKGHNGQL